MKFKKLFIAGALSALLGCFGENSTSDLTAVASQWGYDDKIHLDSLVLENVTPDSIYVKTDTSVQWRPRTLLAGRYQEVQTQAWMRFHLTNQIPARERNADFMDTSLVFPELKNNKLAAHDSLEARFQLALDAGYMTNRPDPVHEVILTYRLRVLEEWLPRADTLRNWPDSFWQEANSTTQWLFADTVAGRDAQGKRGWYTASGVEYLGAQLPAALRQKIFENKEKFLMLDLKIELADSGSVVRIHSGRRLVRNSAQQAKLFLNKAQRIPIQEGYSVRILGERTRYLYAGLPDTLYIQWPVQALRSALNLSASNIQNSVVPLFAYATWSYGSSDHWQEEAGEIKPLRSMFYKDSLDVRVAHRQQEGFPWIEALNSRYQVQDSALYTLDSLTGMVFGPDTTLRTEVTHAIRHAINVGTQQNASASRFYLGSGYSDWNAGSRFTLQEGAYESLARWNTAQFSDMTIKFWYWKRND
jgi:hypothetical protein